MTALAWVVTGLLCWPMAFFVVECVAGLRDIRPVEGDAAAPPRFAVLIPAHDEAPGIAQVIAAVRAQLRPSDRVVVIADNCTDATAAVARRAGATVAERDAPDRIGKAYALAFGRGLLRADPPGVVVLLDADCLPSAGALARLAATAARHQAAVQGRYLLGIGPAASAMVRISAFAFLVRNQVRPRGLQRLGNVAQLQGSGMALPWRMFADAPLATASLVEDLTLGLDLSLAGRRVRFDDAARFAGTSASQVATVTQRTRWEQGMLATAATYVPKLIVGAARRPSLMLLAADLSVPPLALLMAGALGAGGALAVGVPLGTGVAPLLTLLAMLAAVVLVLATIWWRFGRAILPARMLVRLPLYVAWKQPIYLRMVAARERRWIRTSRLP